MRRISLCLSFHRVQDHECFNKQKLLTLLFFLLASDHKPRDVSWKLIYVFEPQLILLEWATFLECKEILVSSIANVSTIGIRQYGPVEDFLKIHSFIHCLSTQWAIKLAYIIPFSFILSCIFSL